ncbi:MAG: methyltransferase [Actinomycetota bacterium]
MAYSVNLDDVSRLREALRRADFTADGVSCALGPVESAALAREQVVPALKATTGGTPLETLIRVFLLGGTEPRSAVEHALQPLPLESALARRLVETHDGGVWATLEVRPYADEAHSWWVVSDLGTDVRPGSLPADHVLGIGGASVTLAQWTVRPKVAAALDIGTGCGVQSLHLSQHSGRVTATDRNPRALELAALTAALGDLEWELLEGDLLEPVKNRTFDLIVSNPPFVVGPPSRSHLYRDGGLAGDAVSEQLIRTTQRHLAEDGWCQLLANWVHVDGADWRDRVQSWLPKTGLDAWVVQREVQDPADYVEMWLRDSGEATGPAYHHRYAAWLDWFAAQGITAVGFGVVNLHNSGRDDPAIVVEELTQRIEPPIGSQVLDWFARQHRLLDADRRDSGLLGVRLTCPPRVRLEQIAAAGADGWVVTGQRLLGGLGPAIEIDPIGAALVSGADGQVALWQQLEILAAAYDLDVDELTAGALPAIRRLVQTGFLDLAP